MPDKVHDVIALCLLHSRRSQVRRRKREHEAAQDDAYRQREEAELAAKRQKLGDGRAQSIYLMEYAHTRIHMYGQIEAAPESDKCQVQRMPSVKTTCAFITVTFIVMKVFIANALHAGAPEEHTKEAMAQASSSQEGAPEGNHVDVNDPIYQVRSAPSDL